MAAHKLISASIWFDKEAGEAVDFYLSAFPESKEGRKAYYGKVGQEKHGQKEGTLMTRELILGDFTIVCLNGGPVFKPNPSVSFFVVYEDANTVEQVWNKLMEGGKALMPLDKYSWSEKYGWVQDKYGVTWQLSAGKRSDIGEQMVCPSLLFTENVVGKAEEAMLHYVNIFHGSAVGGVMRYDANALPDKEGTVMHEQFTLSGETMMAADSAREHGYTFNEGVSLIINCDTQEQIDHYWEKLSEGGDAAAQECGWLKDKFGLSWQVVPVLLDQMLQHPDVVKRDRVTEAFLNMKKMDIAALEKAFNA